MQATRHDPLRRRLGAVSVLLWGGLGVALLLVAVLGVHRMLLARSVLEHPVIATMHREAQARDWNIIDDQVQRPGPLEPLWLAGMFDAPYRRTLVIDTGLPLERNGPLVEGLVFGDAGWHPDTDAWEARWRTSPVLANLSRAAGVVDGDGFLGYPEQITLHRRARRISIEVADGLVAVSISGGERGRVVEPIGGLDPPVWHDSLSR